MKRVWLPKQLPSKVDVRSFLPKPTGNWWRAKQTSALMGDRFVFCATWMDDKSFQGKSFMFDYNKNMFRELECEKSLLAHAKGKLYFLGKEGVFLSTSLARVWNRENHKCFPLLSIVFSILSFWFTEANQLPSLLPKQVLLYLFSLFVSFYY